MAAFSLRNRPAAWSALLLALPVPHAHVYSSFSADSAQTPQKALQLSLTGYGGNKPLQHEVLRKTDLGGKPCEIFFSSLFGKAGEL